MTRDQLTECMHAVLEGTATPEQSMLLGAVLASDAEAAAEFESWKALFGGLDALPPAQPPEDLVARIAVALPAPAAPPEQIVVAAVQLQERSHVVAAGPRQPARVPPDLRAIFRRPTRPDSPQEHRHMNVKRKIWAGGAIAVVALGVAILVSGYPPKAENVLGTVVPAERYRAPQAGAETVKLGEPAAATPTAVTERTAIQSGATEAQTRAQASDAKVSAQSTDARMQADKLAQQQADLTAQQQANLTAQQKANLTAQQKANQMAQQQANLTAQQQANLMAQQQANLTAQQQANHMAQQQANHMAQQQANHMAQQQANQMAQQQAQRAAPN
jgi:hypothetical protein